MNYSDYTGRVYRGHPGVVWSARWCFFFILRVLTRGVWWDDWNGDICYFTQNFGHLEMMLMLMIEHGASLRSKSGGDVDSSRWRNRSTDRPHAYRRLWDQLRQIVRVVVIVMHIYAGAPIHATEI